MVTSFCRPFLNDVSLVWFVQCTLDAESSLLLWHQQYPFPGSDSISAELCLVLAQGWHTRLKLGEFSGAKCNSELGYLPCSPRSRGFWCWQVRQVGESALEIFFKIRDIYIEQILALVMGPKGHDFSQCWLFLILTSFFSSQNTEDFYEILWIYSCFYSPLPQQNPFIAEGIVCQSMSESPVRMQNYLMGNQKKDPNFKYPLPLFPVQQ